MNLNKIPESFPDHQFSKDYLLKIDDFDEFGQNFRILPRSSIFKGFSFENRWFWWVRIKSQDFSQITNFQMPYRRNWPKNFCSNASKSSTFKVQCILHPSVVVLFFPNLILDFFIKYYWLVTMGFDVVRHFRFFRRASLRLGPQTKFKNLNSACGAGRRKVLRKQRKCRATPKPLVQLPIV